jgi:hypothetical protein
MLTGVPVPLFSAWHFSCVSSKRAKDKSMTRSGLGKIRDFACDLDRQGKWNIWRKSTLTSQTAVGTTAPANFKTAYIRICIWVVFSFNLSSFFVGRMAVKDTLFLQPCTSLKWTCAPTSLT